MKKGETKLDVYLTELRAKIDDLPAVTGSPAEGTVIYLIRSMANVLVRYAEKVRDTRKDDVEVDYIYVSMARYWTKIFGIGQKFNWTAFVGHLNASMRHILSILICFLIGYIGYGEVVPAKNAGIAIKASFLLGSVPGSALQGNLKKLQGIVLGTAGGQLIFPITSAMASLGPIVLAVVLFVYIGVTFYISQISAEYALVGILLAAFGSAQLLTPPSGTHDTMGELAAAYSGIIMAIIAILVMTLVDMLLAHPLLGKEAPEVTAKKAYHAFLDSVQSAVVALLGGDCTKAKNPEDAKVLQALLMRKDRAKLLLKIEGMDGPLGTVNSFAEQAANMGARFNADMYTKLTATSQDVLDYVWILASAMVDAEPGNQKVDPAAMTVNDEMISNIRAFLDDADKADSAFSAFDTIKTSKQKMVPETPGVAEATDPVVKYAMEKVLTFKGTVWKDAKATAA